jgi:cyd operon protein YbgT
MWYFAWILGVTMAVLLAMVNAMWCEAYEQAARERESQKRETEQAKPNAGRNDTR